MSEIRLRLFGDRSKAASYLPEARKVLGEVWNRDIVLGGLTQSWRKVSFESGAVTILVRVYVGQPPTIAITAGAETTKQRTPLPLALFVAWYPEGLLFTPVSRASPDGVGLPSRDPLTGDKLPDLTNTEPFYPQVLLNRFQNNKYLDLPGFISGADEAVQFLPSDPNRLRDVFDERVAEAPQEFRHWPKLPYPQGYSASGDEFLGGVEFWAANAQQRTYPTVPGAYLVTEEVVDGDVVRTALIIKRQREELGRAETIFEPEAGSWYSHRPEEVLYPAAGHEKIFQLTNEYRTALGRRPLFRQLRGDGNPAEIAVREVSLSGDFSHHSADFRPGLRNVNGKVLTATGDALSYGENLIIDSRHSEPSAESGEAAAEGWRGSPGHYSNMIDVEWDEGAQHSIGWTQATVDRRSESIPGIAPYPEGEELSGGMYAQLFHRRPTWTNLVNSGYEGDYGFVGWDVPTTGVGNTERYTTTTGGEVAAYVVFRGVRYAVPNTANDSGTCRMLAAAVYAKEITPAEGEPYSELWFRAMVLSDPAIADFVDNGGEQTYGDTKVIIYTAPVGLTEDGYDRAVAEDKIYPDAPNVDFLWEVESEFELPFAEDGRSGWTFLAHGQAAVSPDGTKMCLSYHRVGTEQQTYLTPTSPRDADYDPYIFASRPDAFYDQLSNRPVRDIAVQHIVHIEKVVGEGWVEHDRPTPVCSCEQFSDNDGTTSPANDSATGQYYRRRLDTSYDYIPVYNEDNNLEFITIEVDERQEQSWTEFYYYKLAWLRFPSGKEFLYELQVLEHGLSPANPLSRAYELGARRVADEADENFIAVIHVLDPVNEDIVFSRTTAKSEFYRPEPPTANDAALYLYGAIGTHGDVRYEVDAGSGDARERYALLQKTDSALDVVGTGNVRSALLLYPLATSSFFRGVDVSALESDRVELRYATDATLYQYRPFSSYLTLLDYGGPFGGGPGWYWTSCFEYTSVFFANPYDNAEITQALQWDFNQTTLTAYLHHATDYRVAVWNPPTRTTFTSSSLQTGKEWTPQQPSLFSNRLVGRPDPHNIAPRFVNAFDSLTRFVRYKDKLLLRCTMNTLVGLGRRLPSPTGPYETRDAALAAGVPTPLFGQSDAADERTRVEGDADSIVVVWSNFDLDAAAQMDDVTDIEPFGRAC